MAFGLIVYLLSCGGKDVRQEPAPPRRQPSAPHDPAPVTSPDWASQPPGGLLTADQLAPEPRIRVGLSTRAEAVRLTSSRPFHIRAGRRWISAYDVFVEKETGVFQEGRVHHVQLASFLSRSGAERYSSSIEDEVGPREIVREAVTGRFAVRVGNFNTSQSAEAAAIQLRHRGFESARTVTEATSSLRPAGFVLRRVGGPDLRTPEMLLLVAPGRQGAWVEVDGYPYRGYLEVSVNVSNRLTVVNVLNMEDYLKGVVPAELSPAVYPEIEAIKAQAVAARTYAVKHLGQFSAEGYDICASPACQVYRGVGAEQRMGNEAVTETSGQVLTFDGKPIDALYTSTCGGRTENVENVFNGPARPYLVSRYCFSEQPAVPLQSRGLNLSMELAGGVVTGLVTEAELAQSPLSQPVTRTELSSWADRAFAILGQAPCRRLPAGEEPVSAADLSRDMTEALCWEGRLPFFLSALGVERLVPAAQSGELSEAERRALAYWILQAWLKPPPDGLRPERALSRQEVLETLYRMVAARGTPPLVESTLLGVEGENIHFRSGDTIEFLPLDARRYLYRKLGDEVVFFQSITALPGDRFMMHRADEGIDLLVLLSGGASFDRSSRFARWTVRKTNDELSRQLNEREAVGTIVDLRPKSYGRSGRVAELEVIGEDGSANLRGLAIRWGLGIRENLFFIDRQIGPEGRPEAWVFTGGGWGHGVGMCQVGAYGMAVAGFDYRQILSHFYPGTEIHNPIAESGR